MATTIYMLGEKSFQHNLGVIYFFNNKAELSYWLKDRIMQTDRESGNRSDATFYVCIILSYTQHMIDNSDRLSLY